jgi:hypothetical protein
MGKRRAPASARKDYQGNVQAQFKEKRDDLYSRYRLSRTPEERQRVIRDMQRFNMDARKYGKVVPPISATSLREAASQKPENPS